MQRVIADNALRHELTDEEGNPLTDEDGEVLLSEMSLADQRLAAEEFLAHLQETGGRDAADIYEENHEEIANWGEEHGFDHLDPASREAMVRAWIADTGYTPKRPGWLRRLISGIRLFFHRRGWFVSPLSDDDILTILAQSAKAGRKRRYAGAGDGTRYAFDGKYFPSWQEVLSHFKNDLKNATLTTEQQQIYDAVTTPKGTAKIRIDDLNELEDVFMHYGSRKKGGRKIISVHYAGLRNPVTALEVVNIGDVIRRGNLVEEGTSQHPFSRSYELTADDGAILRVVLDYWRKGEQNRSVINFYSDRKPGAHNVSSRRFTDHGYNLPQSGEKSSGKSEIFEKNPQKGAENGGNGENFSPCPRGFYRGGNKKDQSASCRYRNADPVGQSF